MVHRSTAEAEAAAPRSVKKVPLQTGICLPQTCNDGNLEPTFAKLVDILQTYLVPIEYRDIAKKISFELMKCEQPQEPISTAGIVFLVILGFYLWIVVVGTALTTIEYFQWDLPMLPTYLTDVEPHSKSDTDEKPTTGDSLQPPYYECVRMQKASSKSVNMNLCQLPSRKIKSYFESSRQFFKCFCFLTNCQAILNTRTSKGELMCVHGIRVLSMAWVILGHTYVYAMAFMSNYVDFKEKIDNFPFEIIHKATFAVDTFLFLGGFLLGYIALDVCEKLQRNVNVFQLWFHRLVRLTPCYVFLVALATLILRRLVSAWDLIGKLNMNDGSNIFETCPQNWWRNLLYINNFLSINKGCLGWTWYLAIDFQIFILGTILLYILLRWNRFGVAAISACLLGSWLLTWHTTYSNNFLPETFRVADMKDLEAYIDQFVKATGLLYRQPHTRAGPYLIGLIFAYMLRNKLPVKPMQPGLRALGWICSCSCAMGVLLWQYHVNPYSHVAQFFFHIHMSLGKSAFSLCIAWVVYCCLTQNAELVNRLLSLKIWIPLSRLTYCAYLCHPIIMRLHFSSQPNAVYYSHSNWIMLFISFFVVSYAVALVMSAVLETPILRLEKIWLKNSHRTEYELIRNLKSDPRSVKNI